MTRRLAKLKNILKKEGVGSFLITNPVNVYYTSGLWADTSSLLITEEDNFILTDFRYKEIAEKIRNFKLKLIDGNFKDVLKKLLKDNGIRQAGFEGNHLPFIKAAALKAFLKKERVMFKPLNGVIEELRAYKDEAEIAEIKKAVVIARKVIGSLKKEIRPGITERRLAAILENLIRACGGNGSAFDTIIASGKNASRPHAYITDKPIGKNEPVLVDFGVKVNHYNCDLTRVFFLGRIQQILTDIYNICREAQARAISMVRPGIKINDVDRAARSFIVSKGYGKFFGHGLGHGVGLDIHELPHIFSKNNLTLKPNMVFTIEPGIYLEDVGGARIEDMVLVTKKGCEILTDGIPK